MSLFKELALLAHWSVRQKVHRDSLVQLRRFVCAPLPFTMTQMSDNFAYSKTTAVTV